MKSGRTLWKGLCFRYYAGVDYVKAMKERWAKLERHIEPEIYSHVQKKLATQEKDAIIWRDTCLSCFQEFSEMPVPEYN